MVGQTGPTPHGSTTPEVAHGSPIRCGDPIHNRIIQWAPQSIEAKTGFLLKVLSPSNQTLDSGPRGVLSPWDPLLQDRPWVLFQIYGSDRLSGGPPGSRPQLNKQPIHPFTVSSTVTVAKSWISLQPIHHPSHFITYIYKTIKSLQCPTIHQSIRTIDLPNGYTHPSMVILP